MAKKRTEAEWTDRVRHYLKNKIEAAGMTYAEVAELLAVEGLAETKASLTNKLARGTFPATFFFAMLRALGEKRVNLDDLE